MATPEGQTIINGLKGLINQVVGIKSDIARVLSAISLLNSLITEGFATIRAAINGIVEIILQLIRSLFGNGDSIDYDRIFEIVHSAHRTTRDLISSAHQATREIIVNQLYAKIEAGFANLESLIKSLKLSV
ncbi:MAG: hypothetical protein RMX63_34975, partial [Aulosira sp. ZfuCHP01]|nr:hypothetical protein [Aulosira sp. ZfuCHP01]